MNWLGFDARAYAAALCGCVAALLVTNHVAVMAGSLPWLAGLVAGLACALTARDKNGPRGLVVAVTATWTAALDEATRSDAPLGPALLELHTGFGPLEVAAYVLGFALALLLGRTSCWRGAGERPAGAQRADDQAGTSSRSR